VWVCFNEALRWGRYGFVVICKSGNTCNSLKSLSGIKWALDQWHKSAMEFHMCGLWCERSQQVYVLTMEGVEGLVCMLMA
jgi:hypothetical protein